MLQARGRQAPTWVAPPQSLQRRREPSGTQLSALRAHPPSLTRGY